MASIYAAIPSYKGISDEDAKKLFGEAELTAAGHFVGTAVIKGLALIDLARAECTAAFMASGMELVLYQDDDVVIEPASILHMVALMAKQPKLEVLSAPCRMRSEGNYFNIVPTSLPDDERLVECLWTGLGCVLIKRRVIEYMNKTYSKLSFKSQIVPGANAVGLFNSIVTSAQGYDPSAPAGENMFLGDDRAFSHRLIHSGVIIHAYVDARTNHRGLQGCLGDEMGRRPGGLVGPEGQPL